MQDPGGWDVLVAHGLGIDHAGHTHDVDSAQMLAKLRETDGHVKQVRRSLRDAPDTILRDNRGFGMN